MSTVLAAVFAKDAETGQYVFYNSEAETLFGLSQEQVIGHTSNDLYSSDTAAEFLEQDARARQAGPAGVTSEHTFFRPDGAKRFVRIKKVLVTDGDVNDKQYVLGGGRGCDR